MPPLQDTRSITALNFILTFILVTAGLVEETASLADSLTNSPVQIRLSLSFKKSINILSSLSVMYTLLI